MGYSSSGLENDAFCPLAAETCITHLGILTNSIQTRFRQIKVKLGLDTQSVKATRKSSDATADTSPLASKVSKEKATKARKSRAAPKKEDPEAVLDSAANVYDSLSFGKDQGDDSKVKEEKYKPTEAAAGNLDAFPDYAANSAEIQDGFWKFPA